MAETVVLDPGVVAINQVANPRAANDLTFIAETASAPVPTRVDTDGVSGSTSAEVSLPALPSAAAGGVSFQGGAISTERLLNPGDTVRVRAQVKVLPGSHVPAGGSGPSYFLAVAFRRFDGGAAPGLYEWITSLPSDGSAGNDWNGLTATVTIGQAPFDDAGYEDLWEVSYVEVLAWNPGPGTAVMSFRATDAFAAVEDPAGPVQTYFDASSALALPTGVAHASKTKLYDNDLFIDRVPLDITDLIGKDGVDWGDAAIEAYLAKLHMGSVPVDFDVPPRTITIPLSLRDVEGVTFDEARTKVQAKAARIQQEGGWLKRVTKQGRTVFADLTNATLKLGGGWGQAHRDYDTDAQLVLEAFPDFFEEEEALDDIVETTQAELVSLLKKDGVPAVIRGDYPARCRIVADNDAAAPQLGLLAALRCRHYSDAATARPEYEAEDLTTLNGAATTNVTGASGGASNAVEHASLSTNWTPILSTQDDATGAHMTHTGTYRVWVRALTSSNPPPELRLVWNVGDLTSPVENAPVALPGADDDWYSLDLGEVRLDAPPVGAYHWQGQIQARGASGGEYVALDKVWLVPVDDSYSLIRATDVSSTLNNQGLVPYSARSTFDTESGAITGDSLEVGGTWGSAGDADDLSAASGVATRAAVSDAAALDGHYALAGSAVYGRVVVRADVMWSAFPTSGTTRHSAVFARYVDTGNHLKAALSVPAGAGQPWQFTVIKAASSISFPLAEVDLSLAVGTIYSIALSVSPFGRFYAWLWTPGSAPGEPLLTGHDPALAAGGALDDGRIGLYDVNTGTSVVTRTYDNFAAWVPDADAVLHPVQSAELRTDGTFRETADGQGWGPTQPPIGDLLRLPPSGLEQRPVELLLKASRGDFDLLPDTGIDDISAQPFYRPCWLFVP